MVAGGRATYLQRVQGGNIYQGVPPPPYPGRHIPGYLSLFREARKRLLTLFSLSSGRLGGGF